jgi:hypothetical protein
LLFRRAIWGLFSQQENHSLLVGQIAKKLLRDSDRPPKENSRKRSVALVGSLRRITTTEHKEIGSYNCLLQHTLFGTQSVMSQMAVPPVVIEYKQKFTELMVSYCVSRVLESDCFIVAGMFSLSNLFEDQN